MLLLIISALIIAIYCLLKRPYSYWKERNIKQGNPWIFFGDSWRMLFRKMNIAETVSYYYQLFPNVRYYGIYRFSNPVLVVRDPDLIRRITVKDFGYFVDRVSITNSKADPIFARNLISLKGDEWRQMRSTLTSSFTSSKMKLLFNLISDAALNFTKHFSNTASVDVEVKDAFTRFTIDVIATTSFGVEVNSLEHPENEFFKMGKEITDFTLTNVFKMLLFQFCPKVYELFHFTIFRKEVNEFFTSLVNETIKMRKEKDIYRPDMIQNLMEARGERNSVNEITDQDITAQALIFFFAGFDSVSSLMTFMAYELAINPEVQEKLRKEILETNEKCSGNISYEEITTMKYMDMVVFEALRKWPPFVLNGRECTKDYKIDAITPDERTLYIPKGMGIQIPTYAIHHDPNYYPEPEKFIPERFRIENYRNEYIFLSFGKGPRNCLGSRFALLEIKTLFFHLLKELRLVVSIKTEMPVKLSKKFSVNIRPENGLWLRIEKI
ncbi:hypothetical protein ABEB36_014418 [Hypothenemus hampei]|uniref:Cytochrome P450 n=1 Tax=Hypothenemus hampei TaxID=57062 RepID=A0ABD1E203_HYPHA